MSGEPQTVLINTCAPDVVVERYLPLAPVDLLDIPVEDPDLDLDFLGQRSVFTHHDADRSPLVGAANIISFAGAVSSFDTASDVNLGRPIGAEILEDVIMTSPSGKSDLHETPLSVVSVASAPALSGSAGGVASKLKRVADRASNLQKITTATVAKSKKIAKTPKVSAKQKLQVKKPATKQQPKIVAFCPLPTNEEEKLGENPTGKRPKKGERTYYQNFDFYFKRTSFRTMALYFKTAYKPFFDKWNNSTSKKRAPTILDSLVKFTDQEFPGLLKGLSEKA